MKTLIVYDSFFGNTEQIALAIGNALGSQKDVEILKVSNVKLEQLKGLKLLVVGTPTRAFRPTEKISSFLKKIPINGLKGIKVATFDTRISPSDIRSSALRFLVKIGGYAAKPIAGNLTKRGGELMIPPEGFFVKDKEGPLKEGEIERAADWAKQIYQFQTV